MFAVEGSYGGYFVADDPREVRLEALAILNVLRFARDVFVNCTGRCM
jgi:hypothetical protein